MNIGGTYQSKVGKVKFTPAWHSSSLPDGSYGGMPMGVILELDGKKIYHTGDTALFSDMSLIGKAGIDLAFVCCGDFYTMGVEDALEAVKLIQPKALVPIHHSTFAAIAQDAQAFCDKAEAFGVKGYPLKPGETLEF
jgi:L-ascorbate metabolism protein UlaG (beta-lactamase superfamily)